MAIDFSSGSFTVNGSQVLAIDSTGRITTPLQSGFYVESTASTAAPAIVIPASTQIFNRGTKYDSTNGRFTAPIAGIYHFKFNHLTSAAAGSGRYDVLFLKNGANHAGSRTILEKDETSTYRTINTEAIIQLAVNDYVQVYYAIGPTVLWHDYSYGQFSGFLIG